MKTNKNISAIAIMKKKQSIDKEGARLIRALIIISIIGLLAMFTNKASAQVRFNVQGDLVSSYVWRGMYQTGASIQPTLSFSVENLSLTAWGSTDFDGYRNGNIPSANKELDLTLAYTFPKLGLQFRLPICGKPDRELENISISITRRQLIISKQVLLMYFR